MTYGGKVSETPIFAPWAGREYSRVSRDLQVEVRLADLSYNDIELDHRVLNPTQGEPMPRGAKC